MSILGYPASVSFKPQKSSSSLWALLTIIPVKFVILIPHFVVIFFIGIAFSILAVLGVLIVLINGEYPKSFERFIVGAMQYGKRISSYMFCLTDKYPPFSLKQGDYVLDYKFSHQKSSSRLWALLTIIPVKFVLVIPHMFILYFMGYAAGGAMIGGLIAVLFTGKFPEFLSKVIIATWQYGFRVGSYLLCMTDEYPPFSWEAR